MKGNMVRQYINSIENFSGVVSIKENKHILFEEAFGYAMDEIRKDENLFDEFVKGFNPRFYYGTLTDFQSFVGFAQDLVDWFFSGDWRYELE